MPGLKYARDKDGNKVALKNLVKKAKKKAAPKKKATKKKKADE
jgi:hypothetical protein|tara:strand:- start:19 stop:147 length:129 start_codon:yes stop_codon:yes gene_type:complete